MLTQKSRATLNRAVAILKNDNWVQVIKIGQANCYVINNSVFWRDSADKKDQALAVFNAQIVTTFGEQDKDVKKNPNISLKQVPTIEPKTERIILDDEDLPPPDQRDLPLD